MNYIFYIIFALAPSVIWLLFFLREDAHPESNRMILLVFFLGMLAALPAALIEAGFFQILRDFIKPGFLFSILSTFLGVALVEEIFKYLVVKEKVLSDPEFDEPIDAMLYMIIAALGCGASENLLFLSEMILSPNPKFLEVISITSGFRFIGATFLHALCSGTLGYFLALSFLKTPQRTKLLTFGFLTVIFLHGFYNLSIMKMEGNLKFVIPFIILVGLTIFVFWGFKKLKKIASICRIK